MAAEFAAAPILYNITCAEDDTEYPDSDGQVLPDGCKHFEIQNRSDFDIRVAFIQGEVDDGTGTFFTVKAGDAYSSYQLWGSATITLFFAHTAGESIVVELICWR